MHPAIAQLILQDRRIAYAITDRRLNVIEVSGATSILQAWPGNWLGRPLLELIPELLGSEKALDQVLDGELPRLELPWVNREPGQGQAFYLTMLDLPHRDRSGRIVGLIHVIQDVSEIGRMEQRLTQQRNELRLVQDELKRHALQLASANAELRRVDEMKSAFVSIAAHELRTPLTSITGYLEMLLDGDPGTLNATQAEYLRIVQGSALRLLQITNDLLDVTRLEMGRLELTLRPTNLAAVVEAVAAEQSPQIESRSQRLTLAAPAGLPPALCDPTRAAQIIGNLLANASKYSPHGSTIIIRLADGPEPGFLQVAVIDQGGGIAPEDQTQLFAPFFRTRNAGKTAASGAGLGLYIARSLIELHGGRIWCESAPGKGTTFHGTFPVSDARPDATPDHSPSRSPNRT